MSQITINDLTFSYDTNYDNIFEHVSFQLDTDWKLGFIGRNGKGKTTFLNLLMGKYQYSGSISSSVSFDYFPYEIDDNKAVDTIHIIKDIIAPFSRWEQEMQECLQKQEKHEAGVDALERDSLEADSPEGDAPERDSLEVDSLEQEALEQEALERDALKQDALKQDALERDSLEVDAPEGDVLERYGRLLELYQAHDGYIIDDLIEKELGKLQVDSSALYRPFSSLSFGERTKVMLAALFLKKNNFLLIDEPTNHLDMEGRETLAQYLKSKNGFILVSHDRAFLDQCIDHVLSINRADIEVVRGNYSSWQQNRKLQDNYELEKNRQLKKDIAVLEEAAKRAAGWSEQVEASKIGTHAADRGAIGHKAAKLMKRAKSIESRKLMAAEEKKSLLKNIEQTDALKINILPFPKKRYMEAEDLSLYYGDRIVAADISFILEKGDRIAIRGKNGSGKSTLFRLINGEEIAYSGHIHKALGLKLSYVSQDTSYLAGDLKDFSERYGLDETIFKTVLKQLDFTRNQFEKNIRDFSGGQKKKVLLAKSLAEPAHVFLWDEPLNYVDVLSRMQIEELILKYQPTMIFVEHDRMFYEKIATKTILLS